MTGPTDGRVVDRTLTVFYGTVAAVALAGQAGAAVRWLGWPWPVATGAVAAVELGGVAVAAYADYRRRLGERAVSARVLSGAVATGAVLVNWLGHGDRLQGGFFAGMSALGYLVWVIHSGARRRDQLRAAGTLPPVPPVYGLVQWVRHPGLTRAARGLALAHPALGAIGSLRAAQDAHRARVRQAAIADVLRRRITDAVDKPTADIATAVYDLDQIAVRLADGADYDTLARLVGADLAPERLAGCRTGRLDDTRDEPVVTRVINAMVEPVHAPLDVAVHDTSDESDQPRHVNPPMARAIGSAAQRVKAAHELTPEATHQQIADQLGVSLSTVKRSRPPRAPERVNGSRVEA